MKRRIFVLITLLFTLSPVLAQSDTLPAKTFFSIKTDLLFLSSNLFGVVNSAALTLEKGFARRHSIQLTGQQKKGQIFNSRAWTLIPEYKFFYSKKRQFSGLYNGIYLKYSDVESISSPRWIAGNDKYVVTRQKSYGAGITLGFQWLIKNHLTIDVLSGLGLRHVRSERTGPDDPFASEPTYKKLQLNLADGRLSLFIGYRF